MFFLYKPPVKLLFCAVFSVAFLASTLVLKMKTCVVCMDRVFSRVWQLCCTIDRQLVQRLLDNRQYIVGPVRLILMITKNSSILHSITTTVASSSCINSRYLDRSVELVSVSEHTSQIALNWMHVVRSTSTFSLHAIQWTCFFVWTGDSYGLSQLRGTAFTSGMVGRPYNAWQKVLCRSQYKNDALESSIRKRGTSNRMGANRTSWIW